MSQNLPVRRRFASHTSLRFKVILSPRKETKPQRRSPSVAIPSVFLPANKRNKKTPHKKRGVGLPDRIRTYGLESRSLARYPAVPRVDIFPPPIHYTTFSSLSQGICPIFALNIPRQIPTEKESFSAPRLLLDKRSFLWYHFIVN